MTTPHQKLLQKIVLFIIVLMTGPTGILSAQNEAFYGRINGTVKGLTDAEIPVVNLLSAKDSSIVKATLCDTSGHFEFDQLKEGNYLPQITHIGYQNYIGTAVRIDAEHSDISIPDIILQRSSESLKEVEIVAKKPFVQRKIDRVVINPDALIGNAGATSLEVLEKAPGVLIDLNGNISLKGKPGVVVFIDNKPTYMASAELANYLRSLPAGSIESIEIMTTPPAGYDAAGNAGIINIKLKRNTTIGLNGGINLSYGQGKYFRTNNSVNFNYRINKLNLFSNISQNQNNTYQDLTINRYYYNSDGVYNSGFTQNSYIKRQNGGLNARIGADYYASKKSTVGIALSGFMNTSTPTNTNNAQLLDANNNIVSFISALSTNDDKWKNGSINVNYAHKTDNQGSEFTANADYINYNSTHTQSLLNNTFSPDHTLLSSTQLDASLPADITIKTAKLDYVHLFGEAGKMEAGVKSSLVNTDNTASFYDVVNGISTPNYEFSNRFLYKENINAGYLNFSREWKSFSVQLGLRVENTNADGHQLGNVLVKDSSFNRQYTNLFPTLYLAWRADTTQTHQFGFSFGRRIDRPDYQDLNPFTYPMDRFTYYGGNPFLQPTFSYNFELTHTFKNILTTTLEYSIADNLINETNEQRANIYYSRPGNFGRQTVYGITMNGNIPLTKWWTLLFYTECKNVAVRSTIYGQPLDEQRWYWWVGPTNQFNITKNLSAELAGSYQTRILSGQFLTISVWQVRAGLSQKVLKGNGSIRLNVSDAFYTNQPGGDIRNIANSQANWLSYLDSRVATISFSYRFNQGKTLKARQSGGSDTEKGRVKAG
jgi:iron complex outermembrane recepter protein